MKFIQQCSLEGPICLSDWDKYKTIESNNSYLNIKLLLRFMQVILDVRFEMDLSKVCCIIQQCSLHCNQHMNSNQLIWFTK